MKLLPLLLAGCLACLAQTGSYDLDAARFLPIEGVTSPSALVRFQGQVLLGADLNDPRTGVYSFENLGALQGVERVYAPQFDLASFYADDTRLVAVASRFFSPLERDWSAQQAAVDFGKGELGPLEPLPLEPDCYNGKHGCGLSAVLFLGPGHFLTIRKQQLARVNTWRALAGIWDRERDFSIGIRRRSNRIVDVKQRGDGFYFLMQDRWVLAYASSADILEAYAPYVELKVALDLSKLKDRLKQRNRGLGLDRLLRAFDWDEAGNLWLLVNSMGFPLEIDDEAATRQSQWLMIPLKATD